MHVEVVTKPAFSVVGIEGRGPANKGPEWIKPLWETAVPRLGEIRDLIQDRGWGLMSGVDEFLGNWGKDEGRYIAGWELKPEAKAPEGWSVWDVPAATYATIECKMATYGESWKYMHEKYLPGSEYVRDGAAHEYYPPEFRDIATDSFYLYFRVTKK
jgi:predicted transcriptional regulator YdeE